MNVSTRSAHGLLALLSLRGVGPLTAERLALRFPMIDELRRAPLRDVVSLVPGQARAALFDADAWERALDEAYSTLHAAQRQGVQVLSSFDIDFPLLLNLIPDKPVVVYLKGSLRSDPNSVACIGTREPSRFGQEAAKRITGFLAENGWSIVSGLAIGVDALCHEAALNVGGHTVAVLANGLDSIYPKKNAALADRILANGGALLSEQSFGVQALPRTLVRRDRLQSGLSVATIVMQTDIVGGSMHTVRYTLLQRRALFAPVPPTQYAHEEKCRGPLALTTKTGRELVQLLKADGEYADFLQSEFANHPPAFGIEGRADYDLMRKKLRSLAQEHLEGRLGRPQLPLI